MLHLDDELAGLLEAADMPADKGKMHTTKPQASSTVSGELLAAFSKSAAAVSISHFGRCAIRLAWHTFA